MATESIDVATRLAISDVLVRYATGIDTRDWTLFRTCFTDDCQADYGDIGVWHSADEITSWMRETHEPCGHTMHRITNVSVTPGDGCVAVRAYVDATVMFGDNQAGTQAAGYYDDELVDTDDGWKIARRRFTVVLLQLIPDGTLLELGPR
jgi:3-phenylpropionate/cinnamic acid dioxygenase small subunit